MADFIDWPTNGSTYRYWFLNPYDASSIKAEAGNYLFALLTVNGWVPKYIGIADNLSERIPCHERWIEAVGLGCTHVLAHIQSDAAKRVAEEQDLIAYYQPTLNTQHRKRGSSLGG